MTTSERAAMTENAVALREQQAAPLAIGGLRLNGLDDLARVAKVISGSGMFKDANTPEKVAVKMFFALTMGFSPIAGLTGVDLIEGNPTPNAHFWAAAIEDSPLYDYSVEERTNEKCTVAFSRWDTSTREWRLRGKVTWTMDDAKQAKLAGKDAWTKYPRAMLWSRCMTEGGRTYCPGLFGGVRAYDPEELGGAPTMGEPAQVIDGLTGEVIDLPIRDAVEPEAAFVGETAPEPVEDAEAVDEGTDVPADVSDKFLISEAQRRRMFAIAKESGIDNAAVKAIVLKITGQDSTKAIPVGLYDAVIDALAQAALDADAAHEEPTDGQAVLAGLKAKHEDPA